MANYIHIGVDEVGRGPFAGPVVVCALYFPENHTPIKGVTDSKQLEPEEREKLYPLIVKEAVYNLQVRDATYIDQVGIYKATLDAMFKSVNALIQKLDDWDHVKILVDGKDKIPGIPLCISQKAIVKGDQQIYEIAAASIVAKVYRDNVIMKELAKKYPEYNFDKHKGYGTKEHIEAIKKYGAIKGVHREKFIHFQTVWKT